MRDGLADHECGGDESAHGRAAAQAKSMKSNERPGREGIVVAKSQLHKQFSTAEISCLGQAVFMCGVAWKTTVSTSKVKLAILRAGASRLARQNQKLDE
jgi:hypothetical protein